VTEEEATEAMQVAMTVGATRMQVMLNTEQSKLGAPQGSAPPAAAPADAPPEPATFTAAEVVPQAGGG
jgi:hypothetical protein